MIIKHGKRFHLKHRVKNNNNKRSGSVNVMKTISETTDKER